jgi:hypothetical protein
LSLTSDFRELRFTLLSTQISTTVVSPGTIDVGEDGRLIGLEVDLSNVSSDSRHQFADLMCRSPAINIDDVSLYLSILPDTGGQSRSAALNVIVGLAANGLPATLTIPRRGAGYEITYPSGNR